MQSQVWAGPTKLHGRLWPGVGGSHSLAGRGEGDLRLAISFPSEQADAEEMCFLVSVILSDDVGSQTPGGESKKWEPNCHLAGVEKVPGRCGLEGRSEPTLVCRSSSVMLPGLSHGVPPALVQSGVLLVFHDQNTASFNACFSVTFKPRVK